MSEDYQKQIINKIKSEINRRIDELKNKHPEQLITKQWRVIFPKGFTAGHQALPVITNDKDGSRLVAEVQFVLPSSLDLNIDDIELVLKDEPYIETAKEADTGPVPVDGSIDLLNRLVLGLNEFVQSVQFNVPMSKQLSLFSEPRKETRPVVVTGTTTTNRVDEVKQNMINSPYLPEWIKSVESPKIYNELMEKLAQAYQQNGFTGYKEFFEKYEKHLLNHGHLHYYCRYKGKPVTLDEHGHCEESFCSKKPYNSVCSIATLKFGGQ